MTDNEIIKAMECCIDRSLQGCKEKECPMQQYCEKDIDSLEKYSLDLINRQKAEIERLQDYNQNLLTANTALSNEILEVKSKAYQEFAMLLKCGVPQETGVIRCADVDNLVKELEGESE